MDFRVILGSVAVIVLLFLGIVFALASAYVPSRLAVAAILFLAAFGIMAGLYIVTKKPLKIIQRVELSGEMKAVPIKCPNCSASIQPGRIKILNGVPYATCGYCGHSVEVAEEPKW